jgi:RNA polymerase-binding transcription factor DksA
METAVTKADPSGGQIWDRLQELKEEITAELIDEETWSQAQPDADRVEKALAAESGEIDWMHRSQLEARLRDITDAQNRMVVSRYGECVECGEQISAARLAADPAVSLCLRCKRTSEAEANLM